MQTHFSSGVRTLTGLAMGDRQLVVFLFGKRRDCVSIHLSITHKSPSDLFILCTGKIELQSVFFCDFLFRPSSVLDGLRVLCIREKRPESDQAH